MTRKGDEMMSDFRSDMKDAEDCFDLEEQYKRLAAAATPELIGDLQAAARMIEAMHPSLANQLREHAHCLAEALRIGRRP
jgi:hypothetical protein